MSDKTKRAAQVRERAEALLDRFELRAREWQTVTGVDGVRRALRRLKDVRRQVLRSMLAADPSGKPVVKKGKVSR